MPSRGKIMLNCTCGPPSAMNGCVCTKSIRSSLAASICPHAPKYCSAFKRGVLVSEILYVLADHKQMEQLFVNNLGVVYDRPVLRVLHSKQHFDRCPGPDWLRRDPQFDRMLHLIGDSRNELHAAAWTLTGILLATRNGS